MDKEKMYLQLLKTIKLSAQELRSLSQVYAQVSESDKILENVTLVETSVKDIIEALNKEITIQENIGKTA